MEFLSNSDAAAVDEEEEGPDNIWIASSNGDISRVQLLLSEGISINGQDEAGYSPMSVFYVNIFSKSISNCTRSDLNTSSQLNLFIDE